MLSPQQKNLATYFRAKTAYYAGEPIMSDTDFDALEVLLVKTNPEILKHVGASERTGKEKLPMAMGSLDQIRNEKELKAWTSKFKKTEYFLTEKIDGNSCLLQYKNGFLVNSWSRGDGVQGASNIRHTAKMGLPQYIPGGWSGFVRGELVIPKKDWANLLSESIREYANARNFVAGFMNKTEGQKELYKYFKFIAFEMFSDHEVPLSKGYQMEMLFRFGFDLPKVEVLDMLTYSNVEKIISLMINESEYEIDGVVVDVDNPSFREFTATQDDLNPTYAVKIKLVSEGIETAVTGIEWSVSKDGLLKPVVLIKPISLSGVTISRVTGYNAKFIVDNQIGVGAIVQVVRSGDVIPKIVGVTKGADEVILPPGIWNKTNVDLISTSDDGSMDMKAKQMEYFFSKMEIDFIGEGAVAKLFDANMTDITAIINNPKILETVIGENGRKAAVIMKKVLSETTPQRLFAALGVFGRGLGERKLKVVFDQYSVEQVLSDKITIEEYCELPGYDRTSAILLVENTVYAKTAYDSIKKSVIFMKQKEVELGSGILSNQILVATGVRLSPELIEKVQAQGGVVSDSFGKSTTILVAKDPKSTSGKMGKAQAMGIKVISLAQLLEMI